jgi:hypothetical protein
MNPAVFSDGVSRQVAGFWKSFEKGLSEWRFQKPNEIKVFRT